MREKKFTTEDFDGNTFKKQTERSLFERHKVKVEPNRIWYCSSTKVAVGFIFQSKQGLQFGLNHNLVPFLTRLEREGNLAKAYVLHVIETGEGGKPTKISSQRTAIKQEELIQGMDQHLLSGRNGNGPFWWINEDGTVHQSGRNEEGAM